MTSNEEGKTQDELNQYIRIGVRKPRTHISREKALYTDYEVKVETNSIAFSCTDSCVRRRYSDFQWLRSRLISQFALERTLPELPPKRVFGRFKKQFLKSRQKGLQIFLEDITSESTYLSDIAVHLFLQTSLSVKEIEERMNGSDSGGELLEELQSPSVIRGRALSRSCSTAADDTTLENDSGFSYSTASSLNDYLTPHTCKSHYMTNGSDERHISENNHHPISSLELSKSERTINATKLSSVSKALFEEESIHHDESVRKISSDIAVSDQAFSDDDRYFCCRYDADDEVDFPAKTNMEREENNNRLRQSSDNNRDKLGDPSSPQDENADDEDDQFFTFRKSSDQTVYTLQRAIEIIRERPKLTDRLFTQDDSDDCFRESEYDVIDTEDDVDVVEVINDTTNYPNTSQIEIKVRAHTLQEEDGRLIEVTTTPIRDKNKLKTGKVKSLPSIRFPIRNKKYKYYRSTSEVSLISSTMSNQLNTVYDNFVLRDQSVHYLLKSKSESDGAQITSDADYLTTIQRYQSNDSHIDTNIETQPEDIPPTKSFPLLSKRRRRKSINRYNFSPLKKPSDTIVMKGRFQVSTIREDNPGLIKLSSHADSPMDSDTVNNIISNGYLPKSSTDLRETDILLNDDALDGQEEFEEKDFSDNFLLKSYEVL